MSIAIPSRARTFCRPSAAAHLTLPAPMTRATRLPEPVFAGRGSTTAATAGPELTRSSRCEARDGGVHVGKDLQDAREAGQLEDPQDLGAHRREAKVSAVLARVLHGLEESAQSGARRVVHVRHVAYQPRAP